MIKKEFPILEFDSNKEALINPDHITKKHDKISERLVICFFIDAIDTLIKRGDIYLSDTIKGENHVPIYRFKDKDVTLIPGKLGAPACAGFLDDFIALGAKHIMFCGGGGVLRSDLTVGKLIVIDSAIRDEGTSYHYIEPSREITANPAIVKKITDFLDTNVIDYVVGKTWTTDAFYRETAARIALRTEEGAIVVEMEQSAMIAVSQFRDVNYGAIIYGGDDVSKKKWDSRNWRDREDIRLGLTELCVEIVQTF
ncbi:nucleoside phosphorylase [Liberiplasma polymorphum]|uniref:nucleoside phosphorylase n=1 Tax=Liberiplasma polymorphum TaxID=3374570 RepID=UPI003773A348